jgi:hypothetical protein
MYRFKVLFQLIRYFGIGWLLYRITYKLKISSGYLRWKLPSYQWSDRLLEYWIHKNIPSSADAYVKWRLTNRGKFFFSKIPSSYPFKEQSTSVTEANAIIDGRWQYFTGEIFDVGMPPQWHLNPLTGQHVPPDRHWTQIADFDAGDIKYIWEASRFSVVYTFVRAYATNQDIKYANAFWQLVEDWAAENPPQLGTNWKCGQEGTFRVMAWCFGLYAFEEHATSAQITRLVAMIAAHGERIEKNIDYARSQNNNHGISEGVGLWTIGILFPELRSAESWAKLGKKVVEAEIRRQVYSDGSYSQYSPNYQRVMLHDAVWALRLGELNGNQFPQDIYEKISLSANFLLSIFDPVSGHVPNHGSNDSALILPLNSASPLDFRPIIQTAIYLTQRECLFDEFYEDLFWLFGQDTLERPQLNSVAQLKNLSAEVGGYYTIRGDDSWLMVRCAEYHARPHHADQLHVDFWWRGINLLSDAGTYLYNGDTPWENGLATTKVHNTVTVDNQDQMTPYSRFLWLDWSRGIVCHNNDTYWEGSHNGYMRLKTPVTHRRGIQQLDEIWLIADELQSDAKHKYDLHWLIPDMPYNIELNRVTLETEIGSFYMYCSDSINHESTRDDDVSGWRSTTYGCKQPAISLYTSSSTKGNKIFWTILSPEPIQLENINDILNINGFKVRLGGNKFIEIEAS